MRTIVMLLSALLLFSGCGSSAICGGYTKQRDITEDELAMFRTATEEMTDAVYTALSVATQVVAGTNYKFRCKYEPTGGVKAGEIKEGEMNPKGGNCWVIIFKPLPGQGDPTVSSVIFK